MKKTVITLRYCQMDQEMTAAELKAYRLSKNLTQKQIAADFGASLRAWQNWEQSVHPVARWVIKRIEDGV